MRYVCKKCNKPFVRNRPLRVKYFSQPRRPLERETPTPQVIHRQCGGYLAISPMGCAIGIGVTAETEDAVLAEFSTTYRRWIEILDLPNAPLSEL